MKKTRLFFVLCICVVMFSNISAYAVITMKVRGVKAYSKSLNGGVGYYHGYYTSDVQDFYHRAYGYASSSSASGKLDSLEFDV